MRTKQIVLRLLAVASIALGGLAPGVAQAARSNEASGTASAAVTIVGDAHGLKLQNEHTNSDGSVTSTWKNTAGQGFIYAGSPGAQVSLSSTSTTVAGKTAQRLDLSVAQPAHTGNANAVMAAYTASGRSVLKDALNAGVSPAVAEAKLGSGNKSDAVTPDDSTDSPILDSWCLTPINDGPEKASACITENLIQKSSSGALQYISDNMEGLGSGTPGTIPAKITGLAVYSDYGSGTVVPPWVPNGSQGTDCHDVTASASFDGIGISSDSTICGGSYVTMLASNTFGMHWSGSTAGQIGLEPIDVVHLPTGNDYTVLHLTLWLP